MFRFSSETPSPVLFSSFQKLNEFPEAQLTTFVDGLLNFLARDSSANIMEILTEFGTENNINPSALKEMSYGIIYFFRSAIRSNLNPLFIKEDLKSFGMKDENADIIVGLWKRKFIQLSRTAIGQTLMVNQLVDMEWKFGITAANDDLGKVGTSWLQLRLVLDKGNNTREDVLLELTLPQFYEVLNELQKAKANLEYLAS